MNEIILCQKNGPTDEDNRKILEKMVELGSRKAKRKLNKNKHQKFFNEFWFIFSDDERYDKYLLQAVKELKPEGLFIKKFKENQYRIIMNGEDTCDIYETLETPKDVKFITIKN